MATDLRSATSHGAVFVRLPGAGQVQTDSDLRGEQHAGERDLDASLFGQGPRGISRDQGGLLGSFTVALEWSLFRRI